MSGLVGAKCSKPCTPPHSVLTYSIHLPACGSPLASKGKVPLQRAQSSAASGQQPLSIQDKKVCKATIFVLSSFLAQGAKICTSSRHWEHLNILSIVTRAVTKMSLSKNIKHGLCKLRHDDYYRLLGRSHLYESWHPVIVTNSSAGHEVRAGRP